MCLNLMFLKNRSKALSLVIIMVLNQKHDISNFYEVIPMTIVLLVSVILVTSTAELAGHLI